MSKIIEFHRPLHADGTKCEGPISYEIDFTPMNGPKHHVKFSDSSTDSVIINCPPFIVSSLFEIDGRLWAGNRHLASGSYYALRFRVPYAMPMGYRLIIKITGGLAFHVNMMAIPENSGEAVPIPACSMDIDAEIRAKQERIALQAAQLQAEKESLTALETKKTQLLEETAALTASSERTKLREELKGYLLKGIKAAGLLPVDEDDFVFTHQMLSDEDSVPVKVPRDAGKNLDKFLDFTMSRIEPGYGEGDISLTLVRVAKSGKIFDLPVYCLESE
jgi:hypothetical protein